MLGTDGPLASVHDVGLFDLDGVIYIGAEPIPHAVEAVLSARSQYGMRAAFVTNNASRTSAQVAEILRRCGLELDDADVVTSAQAAARVLADELPPGSRVLVLGSQGLRTALIDRGLTPVASMEEDPVAVVQGYNPQMTWSDLAEASYAINRGLLWVASNTDRTIPTPRGIAPGNGSLVAALVHATGREPIVAGKPEPPLMVESVERTGARAPLVIGDRLDTDIEGAVRSDVRSLLVFSGVTRLAQALQAGPQERPDFVGWDCRALLDVHPGPEVTVRPAWPEQVEPEHGVTVTAQARGAKVTVSDQEILIAGAPDSGGPFDGFRPDGDDPRSAEVLDLVRAACEATWAWADLGRPECVGRMISSLSAHGVDF